MGRKILSIIIPTYNMEKYISKCLDSLLIPSIDKLDIIIVNDGSKDKSSEIAHLYEKLYPDSIRVIDKENGNYGSCINVALPTIQGKYVRILDADDTFDTENLEKFIDFLFQIETDLIISDYVTISENNKIIKKYNSELLNPNKLYELKKLLCLNKKDLIAMHSFTYNSSIFSRFNYYQTEGISYTDSEWYIIPVIHCNSFCYYNKIIYKYLIGREGQTMDPSIFYKNVHNLITVADKISVIYYQTKDISKKETKDYLFYRLIELYYIIYFVILIKSPTPSSLEILKNIDIKILKNAPNIFKQLENVVVISRFKLRILKFWRNSNYNQRNINVRLMRFIYKLLH